MPEAALVEELVFSHPFLDNRGFAILSLLDDTARCKRLPRCDSSSHLCAASITQKSIFEV